MKKIIICALIVCNATVWAAEEDWDPIQSSVYTVRPSFHTDMEQEMKCTTFEFTQNDIDSFQNWNRLILLMPVKLSTAFYSIKMHFNCPIGVGGGRLGLFMMNENEQTETIEAGLFMSGRGEINQDSCPVTLDDGLTGDKITLLPGRYAGKYGTTKVTPVYAGQTVRDLLTQNKGSEYVETLAKRIEAASKCRLYLGYLSDHGFCLDVTNGGFEAKYTED